MKRKSIWIIIASVIVIVACAAFLLTRTRSTQNVKPSKQNNNAGLMISKNKSKPKKTADNEYSTDNWMLMGYMAYAHDNYVESRHIKNNADLVEDVGEDLADGALKAVKTDDTTYHLTNKFGSVDVTVEDDDVKVTGDGSTYNEKSELKSTFNPYLNQIKKMSKDISTGSADDDDSESDTTNFDARHLAVFARFIISKSYTKDAIMAAQDKYMRVGVDSLDYDKKTGWYNIDGHGDPTTVIPFKLEGNVLVTKHVELEKGKSVAESPMVTKRTPMSEVVKRFYSTPSQKAEVDKLAKVLLTYKEWVAIVQKQDKDN